jgi:3-hydroxyisobutyrate dehydrogenase-like beta-hydroxyacid dehydrogenase
MDIAIGLAESLGVPLLLTQIVRQIYQMNVVRGRKDEDTSSIVKLFEELMGLPEVKMVIDKT